jgi:biopolymer transport protein ExbD
MSVQVKKGNALGALSITPLIDVVFLLLIFFLVTSKFEQEEREVDLTLPAASEAQPLIAQPKELFVNVDREGRFFVDGRIYDEAGLERVLRQAVRNNPMTQTVIIRADEAAQHGAVFTVVRLCNKVGVADASFAGADE